MTRVSPGLRNRRPRPVPVPRGFTILELLVALTITAVIVLFVSTLFNSTGEAVTRGVNITAIAAGADAASETFNTDFDHTVLFGPVEDGILVIIHHAYDDVPLHDASIGDGEVARRVRSDQVFFLRRAGSGRHRIGPAVPAGVDTFTPPVVNDTTAVRIWYGHVRKTHPAYGLPVMSSNSVNFNVGDLGQAATGDVGDINLWGDEWIVGRQAMFLQYDSAGHPNGVANVADHRSAVVGEMTTKLPKWFTSSQSYMSLADVADVDHRGTDANFALMISTSDPDDSFYFANKGCTGEPCSNQK